jgi:hypothetical protein
MGGPAGQGTASSVSDAISQSVHSSKASGHDETSLPPLSPKEAAEYDPETVLVGSKLLMDMEKAGIHLPETQRLRMQELMNLNQHFGMSFNAALSDLKQLGHVTIGTGSRGETGGFLARLSGSKGQVLPLDSPTMHHVLVSDANEDVRRQVSHLVGHVGSPLMFSMPRSMSPSGVPGWKQDPSIQS